MAFACDRNDLDQCLFWIFFHAVADMNGTLQEGCGSSAAGSQVIRMKELVNVSD